MMGAAAEVHVLVPDSSKQEGPVMVVVLAVMPIRMTYSAATVVAWIRTN